MTPLSQLEREFIARRAAHAAALRAELTQTEDPTGRPALVQQLRWRAAVNEDPALTRAADMLEADASLLTHLARRTTERNMAIQMVIDALQITQA